MVTYLDDTVGKVLEKLREAGLAENTLVIFSSDNGAMSEGGWSRQNFDSSGPLRGGKRDLYEGGIRVPMIAYWPGKVAPATTSPHVCAFWDFAATACQLAGVDPPEDTDGISFAAALLGEGTQPQHEYLYWEFHERGGKQAVRWGKWKGVRLGVQQDRNAAIELYDLSADLGETNNVAVDHPEVVEQIARFMQQAHDDSGVATFKPARRRTR